MVGASSVPVIVTVTSWVIVPPMLVVDGDGVGLGDDLADRQLLRQRVVDREGPVHRADIVGVGCSRSAPAPACRAAGSPDRSRAAPTGRAAGQRLADQMGVDQIDVLERDRPGRGLRGRPPPRRPMSSAGVVAAVMVGASSAPVMVTVTSCVTVPPMVVDADRVDLRDGLTGQRLQHRIVVVEREGPAQPCRCCWCRCAPR